MRSSLTIDPISDLMTVKLLGKELTNWDVTPFVKSWLGCNHRIAADANFAKKKKNQQKAFN